MISWLNDSSGAVIAMLTAVLIAVTYLYVRYTRDMVGQMQSQRQEMQKQRMDALMPILSVGWRRKTDGTGPRILTVVNVGPGTAMMVSVKAEREDGSWSVCGGNVYRVETSPIRSGQAQPLHQIDADSIKNALTALRIDYKDVYGRRFVTTASVAGDSTFEIRFWKPGDELALGAPQIPMLPFLKQRVSRL